MYTLQSCRVYKLVQFFGQSISKFNFCTHFEQTTLLVEIYSQEMTVQMYKDNLNIRITTL